MKSETERTVYYRSLLRNIVLTILITAITPTVGVSIFILDAFRVSYEEKIYDHFDVLTRKHKRSIDIFLEEKLMDIRLLAKTNRFEDLTDQAALDQRFNELQRAFDRSFVDLGVVDHQGFQIAYAGPLELTGVNYSGAKWFEEAISSPFFISDVFKGMRGAPHFIVSVRQERDGRPWILRATIDFREFNDLVEFLRIGKTGFAFILNADGQFQTKPIAGINTDELVGLFGNSKIVNQSNMITRKRKPGGNEIIYAMTTLKNGDWIMVIQQDASDAFAELKKTQRIVLLFILIGSLGIIAASLILSNRLVSRISQADTEKEQALRKKDMMSQQVIETGKLASVGELAAGIAHEINNPIAIMIEEAGWIEDLLEEEGLTGSENEEEFYRALSQIKTQGRRCKEITHKLLSFARKTDSRIVDISVATLLTEIAHLSSQRAKYSNVEIQTDFEDNLPPIPASETEMQQVFLNLVNNALDALEKTGGIIMLNARRADGDVIVTVSDNGPGIAEANLGRVFDPFYTTKPVGKGTGLGLSICFGIIKKIGGDIHVSSTKGEGTAFEIRFPVAQVSPGALEEEKAKEDTT
ncbi:ATP-binding protein [uncultured Desulfosarcina sp.]|uniref:sensor histidine kinase n=1 Tax=uncultured Desulfosarcina sp. TaxID=218289 RepID=UPI0029C6EA64|nr:ATP-binding protein [uncultured Desulfosarcina sp.]